MLKIFFSAAAVAVPVIVFVLNTLLWWLWLSAALERSQTGSNQHWPPVASRLHALLCSMVVQLQVSLTVDCSYCCWYLSPLPSPLPSPVITKQTQFVKNKKTDWADLITVSPTWYELVELVCLFYVAALPAERR